MVDPDWLPTGQASVPCAHVLVRTHTWSVVTCEAEVLGTALDRLLFPLLLRPPPGENEVHQTRGQQSDRSEEHTSELQSRFDLVCRLLLEKKKDNRQTLQTEEHMMSRKTRDTDL